MVEEQPNINNLILRVNEKIQHVNEIIAQKLEYQGKFIEQRLESIERVNAEKLLTFSTRLEEALVEIRGYKDILQQQLALIDSSIKKAHSRLDDLDSRGSVASTAKIDGLRKELVDSVKELETVMEALEKIEKVQHDEVLVKEAQENEPVRKFLTDNGKKILTLILIAIAAFILKNIDKVIEVIQKALE